MKLLRGRVAVVTGGANGIGYALAERFLAEGMKVMIADLNAAEIDAAVGRLAAHGEVAGHVTDVRDPAAIEALAQAVMERHGAVHVLCNNAGVGGFQRFGSTSAATWDWILGVNLMGTVHGCRIFLPILERQDEAHIVNTASMAGFTYSGYNHPYNVSKAGVVALSEGMYREFAREKPHVGVSVLCPAFTATRIGDDERNAPAGHTLRADTDPDLEPLRRSVGKALARGKPPAELADLVVRGMRARTLHLFPHPEWLAAIEQRMRQILAGEPVGDEPAALYAPLFQE